MREFKNPHGCKEAKRFMEGKDRISKLWKPGDDAVIPFGGRFDDEKVRNDKAAWARKHRAKLKAEAERNGKATQS